MLVTLSYMLAGLKVGFVSKYLWINILYSIKSLRLLNIIYKLGYIRGYTIISNKKIKVYLKYVNNTSVLRNIYMVSKPSRRFYMKHFSLKGTLINNFISFNGFLLISTNNYFLTDVEAMIFKQGGLPLIFVS